MIRIPSISRRVLALGTVSCLALSGVGMAMAAGEGGGLGLPTAGCNTWTDPVGDAVTLADFIAPVPDPIPNDPDLDITGVAMGVSATAVTAYLRVDTLSTSGPTLGEGEFWHAAFTARGKDVEINGTRALLPLDDVVAAAGLGNANYVSVAGSEDDTITTTVTFDTTHNLVILSADRATLEKALGGALAGTSLTGLDASSEGRIALLDLPTDDAPAPAGTSFAVGANSCFGDSVPTDDPSATDTPTDDPTDQPTDDPTDEPTDDPSPTDSPAPTGGVLFDQPRANCFLFKDDSGDAFVGQAPLSSPQSDDDLDLTQVAVKSAPDALQVFAKVTALGSTPTTLPPVFDGHKFTASFSVGGKTVTAVATGAGAATTTPAAVHATAAFDTAKSNVVFTFPKADLESAIDGPLQAGDPITGLTIVSNATSSTIDVVTGDFDGDTAAGSTEAEKTYSFGDNTCFQPPPGKITLSGATTGAYSDTATITATLVDSADAAVAGHLSLVFAGQPARTTGTDPDGNAVFTLPINVAAGAKTITVTFAGDDEVGPAAASEVFTVVPETAVLKAAPGTGTVKATLLDNDNHPIAGQLVAFTVGKTVTKLKTNAKGQAQLTKQRKGTAVKVDFAAVSGLYAAAKSVWTKVL